ncbi:MAG: SRPBCC domain-containing protein [Bacteroidetes bacterium]|nr:SRPBCC domain-containing protein [Bacteroidota bacterium]
MKTKTVEQKVTFENIFPEEVYHAFMDSKKHSAFTGAKATISKKAGGKYSAYDGYHGGVNLELIPGKKIVQSWHASNWPKGHFGKATFSLKKTKTGTQLSLVHAGIPDYDYKAINNGWKEYYWKPMKKYFALQKQKS